MVVGVGMVPRGEVGLIFAEIGRRSGVLGEEVFGAVLLMVMVTTFIAPPALKSLFASSGDGS
jgi:Kef-type K+ transport system membrane component KefB